MSGSVIRDPKRGTWSFVVDLVGPGGNRRQSRKRGFKTKKAASQALAAVVADQTRGTFHRPSKITVAKFLNEEWLPAKAGSLRASTLASYEQAIRNYIVPSIGQTKLTEVDGSMLNALYGQLLTSGRTEKRTRRGSGLSPKTVRNVHGVLTKAFHDGVRWNRILRNPCDSADPPRGTAPEMKAWTRGDLSVFINSVANHRWSGAWTLLATTGMRRGEILGLRWTDVDLASGTVTIRATRIRYGNTVTSSTPKTAKGNRTITIGEGTVAALKTMRSAQAAERLLIGSGWVDTDGLVVTMADGSAPNPEAFSNLFHRLSKAADLPSIRFHDLRHSYATAALASGVPVKVLSQRLGHADVGVTLKIYAHVMPGDDEDAARRADAVLGIG